MVPQGGDRQMNGSQRCGESRVGHYVISREELCCINRRSSPFIEKGPAKNSGAKILALECPTVSKG
jgi:hypothetical protein